MKIPPTLLPSELRYFEEVARCGSIREAAESLNIAGSAVSRQINKLEEDLAANLFKRTSYGMKLTQAGRILLAYVEQSKREIERTKSKISDIVGMRDGDLIVFTIESLLDNLVLSSIADFHRANKNVEIVVNLADSSAVLNSLQKNMSDIGVALNTSPRMEIEVIGRIDQRLFAVTSSHHPIAGKAELSLSECLNYPLAIPDLSSDLGQIVKEMLEATETVCHAALTANSLSLIKGFAKNEGGVALLPPAAIQIEAERGELIATPLLESRDRRDQAHICQRRDASHSVAADAFITILKRRASELR